MNSNKMFMMAFLLVMSSAKAAVFTIENYTGADITVELRLNKSWGASTKQATIMNGQYYTFDTSVYGVISGGITWKSGEGVYHLPGVSVDNPLMIGGVVRLFKTGTYEYLFSDGRSGSGRIREV